MDLAMSRSAALSSADVVLRRIKLAVMVLRSGRTRDHSTLDAAVVQALDILTGTVADAEVVSELEARKVRTSTIEEPDWQRIAGAVAALPEEDDEDHPYNALAEWLDATGRWPDPEDSP
jgi:hypothetical protein